MRSLSQATKLALGIVLIILCLCVFVAAVDSSQAGTPVPILVELFTSEGCSSCPPADLLLTKLDSLQPVPGAQTIVLSEHVDYWNHDGWKDPYSSSSFTARQNAYEQHFRVNSAYTPQIVVDGAAQVNGSDARAAVDAIEAARSAPRVSVRIGSFSMEGPKTLRVHLKVDALPESLGIHKADIFVAVALDHLESHVLKGENKGRDLKHVAVVLALNKVGTLEKRDGFERDVDVKLPSAPDQSNLRLVAFVQKPDFGQVLGASLTSAEGDKDKKEADKK
jgi:hypothetical protein